MLVGRRFFGFQDIVSMLSSSLSQLLERARTRFGLEVEVLDSTLQHVYPDSTTALARMIDSALAGGAGLTRLPSGHGPDGYR